MNHDELEGLSKDDHKQYLFVNPTTDTRNYILPSQATTVGLTIKGALGQKADLVRIQSFKGDNLAQIKADGSIKSPKVESDEAILETLHTKTSNIGSLACDLLEAGSISCGQINQINLNDFKSAYTQHEQNKNLHFQQHEINHEVIQNRGKYNHKTIDAHIDRADLHYTIDRIDHRDIQGIGKKTHAEIDAHIADESIHYTQNQIKHGAIQGLNEDHHQQYVLASGSRPMKTLTVDKEATIKGALNAGGINTGGLGANNIRAPYAKVDQLDASTVKCEDLYCNKSKANEVTVKDLYTHGLEVRDDVVINGRLYCEDVQSLRDDFENHKNNIPARSTHKPFTNEVNGFVPAPAGQSTDYRLLTSNGTWKSIGQYLEVEYENKEIINIIQDRVYDWNYSNEKITIPVRGVYEITLFGISSVSKNEEVIRKSLHTGGNPFLLDLKTDGVTLSLELSGDYSRVYIKKIDDYYLYQ